MARETRATSSRRAAKRHNPAATAGRIRQSSSSSSPAKQPTPSASTPKPSSSSSSPSSSTTTTIRQDEPPATTTTTATDTDTTPIHEDDLCPICHLLLHRPVRTTCCGHALCRGCMARWADVSATSTVGQMTAVPLSDEHPPPEEEATTDPLLLVEEARCPMCRTATRAVRDARLEEVLRERYRGRYGEEGEEERKEEGGGEVRVMTVFVGNGHRLLEAREGNCHEWTFFVRPGNVEVVEEVQILLHPTFRPPRVIRAMPPYQITRLGWGYFTVQAYIILKAGYTWVSEDAQPSPDGVENGMLPLEWMLSFDGEGSMARCRLKYKHEISTEEDSDSSYDDDSEYEEE